MAKTDIQHAYKLIPIHPHDVPALGIRWFNHWQWDCTLPVGCRVGCAIFEAFSDAIQFLAEARGCGGMCHVLDDFIMVSTHDTMSTERLTIFLRQCDELGVPIVVDKTEPGSCLVFLGITLDTVKMQARLPPDKLAK